jgi:hypothetical protein
MHPRALPRVGASVVVVFLAARVQGEVVAVDPDLRGLEVLTEEGELIRFKLRRTTGRFQSEGSSGAPLFFDEKR